ncbi:MAG: enolase C-terminal domain-like protein [Candidatus Zixiibacteriota bacterium]
MQFDAVRISIPLKQRFSVSGGSTEVKTNVLTVLNNRYSGEASGSVYYGPSIDAIESDIRAGLELLRHVKSISVETLAEIDKFDILPIARSALIGMTLNYLSGEMRKYPWEVLSLGTPVGIKSSCTISLQEPVQMLEAIRQSEFPIVKVKMGGQYDPEILTGLESIGGKEIRVDANGGWTCDRAQEMIFHLARLGITIIEQPTDVEFLSEWQHLKGKNDSVRLIMDEGLNSLANYEMYSDYFDGINIKMEKSGGILEGIRLAERAHEDGKQVMLGCMVESSIGIAQSVYMSSQADCFDLDGPLLLKDDLAEGIRYDRESIEVDREIIGGPKLKRDVIERYTTD